MFDYADPECGKKIKEYTKNSLRYAFDCISSEDTAKICAEALTSEAGAHYGAILDPEFPRKDVKYTTTVAYVGLGEDFGKYDQSFTGNESHGRFQTKWWEEARSLLAAGKVKPHPVGLRQRGLVGAIEGFQEMEEGKYTAEKLVYRVQETP